MGQHSLHQWRDAQPVLVSFDLGTFVAGGTNADGSIHQIAVTMVGSGGDFR